MCLETRHVRVTMAAQRDKTDAADALGGIDAIALRKRPQARLTMLYRSTDRLCRCGAPMQNLAHSASFDSDVNDEPSKPGIKHLALCAAPLLVFCAGIVMQRIVALQRRALHELLSRKLFPIVMLLRFFNHF